MATVTETGDLAAETGGNTEVIKGEFKLSFFIGYEWPPDHEYTVLHKMTLLERT